MRRVLHAANAGMVIGLIGYTMYGCSRPWLQLAMQLLAWLQQLARCWWLMAV